MCVIYDLWYNVLSKKNTYTYSTVYVFRGNAKLDVLYFYTVPALSNKHKARMLLVFNCLHKYPSELFTVVASARKTCDQSPTGYVHTDGLNIY